MERKVYPVPVKSESGTGTAESSTEDTSKTGQASKLFILADLNNNPPETDADANTSPHLTAPELTR